MSDQFFERSDYLDRISPYVDQPIIKVLVGQRRVGKSSILREIVALLRRKRVAAKRILLINKEEICFDHIRNYKDLYDYVNSHYEGKKLYLLIDEVQHIEQFEKALADFLARGIADIYCTGSNASLLSSELATLLAGRSITIEVYSLSFLEFKQFHRVRDSHEALAKYIRFGGMPYLHYLKLDAFLSKEYLQNIYSSIVLKDVVARFSIRNTGFLEQLVMFLSQQVGSLISAKRISDYLNSIRRAISPQLALQYLSHLSDAYLVHKVPRFDIIGKKVFEINDKYYFTDWGLRNALVGYNAEADIGRLLENIVYIHLRRLGYSVYVGVFKDYEIDFVAEKDGVYRYIQVAYLLKEADTVSREFGNLLKIPDNYPKYLISMDESAGGSHNGAFYMHMVDFLEGFE